MARRASGSGEANLKMDLATKAGLHSRRDGCPEVF